MIETSTPFLAPSCLSLNNDDGSWNNENHSFTSCLRKETSTIVCNFLSKLSSHPDKDTSLCDITEEFCQKLTECAVKVKSLPATQSAVALELSLIYNLLYAKIVMARLEQCCLNILTAEAWTVLISLGRAQEVLGVQLESQDNVFQGDCVTDAQRVSTVLSSLLTTFNIANSRELGLPLGLLACMWSFLVVKVTGPHTPLHSLSLLQHWTFDVEEIVQQHGFLLIAPQPDVSHSHTDAKGRGDDASCAMVSDLASLLLASSCFHREEWEECRKHASRVKHSQHKALAILLAACAMVGGGQCLEAVGALHTLLHNDAATISSPVLSRLYALLASCYSAQGLPNLAIEMLRRSGRIQPESTTVLLKLAGEFRNLQQESSEVDCLHKLAQVAARSGQKPARPMLLTDLLLDLVDPQDKVTASQAVYLLASRLASFKRYEEASKSYLKLIQMYENEQDDRTNQAKEQHPRIQLPDLLTICRQAAETLVAVEHHRQCLQLCDRVLNALASTSTTSQLGRQASDWMILDESLTASQLDETIPNRSMSGARRCWNYSQSEGANAGSQSGVKRCWDTFGDGSNERIAWRGSKRTRDSVDDGVLSMAVGEEQRPAEWRDEENTAMLLMCKAQCLVMLGDLSTAVKVLDRALDGLKAFGAQLKGQESLSRGVSSQGDLTTLAPNPKRPRYSVGQEQQQLTDTEGQREGGRHQEDEAWRAACGQVCVHLTDLHGRCDQPGQALHYARLAAQLQPESEVCLYVLASALCRLGRGQDGGRAWLPHRHLPHYHSHTDTASLHALLRHKQDTIRTLPEEKGDSTRLGVVTERQKLDLDIACLTSLVDSRLNS